MSRIAVVIDGIGTDFSCFSLLFTKLGLLLMAIEMKDDDKKECNININPGPHIRILPQTQGFFIAQSADEVKRYFTTIFVLSFTNSLEEIQTLTDS